MDEITALCGLMCSECPAYLATQANDPAALERVAEQWREQFNAPEMTADSIVCDGCLGHNEGRMSGYGSVCEIRACAMGREVVNCAHCDDYGCETIVGFFGFVPEAKATLDGIRAQLNS